MVVTNPPLHKSMTVKEVKIMPEKELPALVEIRATPEIEAMLVEQMKALPNLALEKVGTAKAAWNCFGLIGCCNGT